MPVRGYQVVVSVRRCVVIALHVHLSAHLSVMQGVQGTCDNNEVVGGGRWIGGGHGCFMSERVRGWQRLQVIEMVLVVLLVVYVEQLVTQGTCDPFVYLTTESIPPPPPGLETA